jgi:methylmalonyl-CoA mutase N-terminal domain/subunit
MMLRFHTQTGGATLTAQQPINNLVRTALQGMSAVLGGTQSLHTNSYDEALSLPSQHAAELALRTQQIIAYESGVGDTIDPVAGSWYVESLTDQVEREAMEYVRRIDDMGGALAAVEQGFQANEIHENAFRIQRDIEAKRKIVVGVNEYVDEEAPPEGLHQHDLAVGERASERICALRARRDAAGWEASMARLEAGARGDANMIPLIIDAVEHYATLGEICARLRIVWGEMHEATQL